jgi:putative endonuclease
MSAYVYILRCADGSLYTGWTTDLSARLDAHNGKRGKQGAKYTRSRRPVVPAYCEVFDSAEEARRRECAIKKMTRAQKETLIAACADIEARLSLFLPK